MIELAIAHLKDQVPALRLVEGAAKYAALKAPPPVASQPAAYVMVLREAAGPNRVLGTVRQRLAVTYGVVLITTNVADAKGAQASAEIDALKQLVRAALIGWQPTRDWEPTTLASGALLDLTGGTIAWMETYTTAVQLHAAPGAIA
jgi:hypothetical protein